MRALLLAGFFALLAAPLAAGVPEQVHLGITEDPSSALSVLWMDLAPAAAEAVRVQGPGGARDVQGALVPGPSAGFVYEAPLRDLVPGSSYIYTLGGRSFAFATPPRSLPPQGLGIAAIGDMGTTAQSAASLAAIRDLAPDLVLHAGDISYAEGDPVAWKSWFDAVEPVAATRPWVVALGNHETYTAAVAPTGESNPEIALFRQRFGLPGNELWYSFDWAGVHIVALDTFSRDVGATESPLPQDEVAWLERDLAAHQDAAWTIVFLHEPAYSSNAAHGSSARVQQALVPLFERHGVDLVIQGHDHAYERSLPVRAGRVAEDGIVYVTSGGGGEGLYTTWQDPAPPWSAARAALYEVLALRITDTAIDGRVVPTAGEPFADSFRIARPSPPAPAAPRPAPDAGLAAPLAVAALGFALARRRA